MADKSHRNPESDYVIKNKAFDLLIGADFLHNSIDSYTFTYTPYNFYPFSMQSHLNLTVTIADMIKKRAEKKSKSEIVIEFDTGHGELGVLVKDHCEKFYPVVAFKHLVPNIELNLNNHDLTSKILFKIFGSSVLVTPHINYFIFF